MPCLQFDCLTLENFRSFAAPQTFVFGEAENGGGLYFLRGKNALEPRLGANGAGKSTLFMALCWVLYGRTPDNLRGPDVKPWKGKGTPRVQLVVYVDGERREIERFAKTNGLRIDGVEAGPDEPAQLLGLSFETFVNTVMLPQQQPLFFDRTPSEKMQLFSDVLKLDRWDERSDAASKKTRAWEDAQAEISGELAGTVAAIEETQELLSGARRRSEEWAEERKERLSRISGELAAKEKRLKAITRLVGDADLAYDAARTEVKALEAELRKAQAAHSSADTTAQIAARDLRKAKEALQTFERSKTCPACGQPLQGKPESHRKELEKAHASALTQLEKAQAAADAAEAVLGKLLSQEQVFSEKAEKALSVLNLQRPAQAALQAEIYAATSLKDQDEANPHTEHIAALRRKVSQQEALKAQLEQDAVKYAKAAERSRFWIKGFKDVKLYLIQEVLEELQLTSNLMLAEMGLEGWKIEYAVEKEAKTGSVKRGINITITSASLAGEKQSAVKWEAWSGGEGQRLRIIGALALSEVLLNYAGVETDLEILDEPTRHLSAQGAQDLCSFLQERAKRLKRNVWLVDHLAHETSQFAGGTLVTKTAKGSVLESW